MSGRLDGISAQTAQSKKMGDRMSYDKPEFSCADFHPELLKEKGALPPKTASTHQKLYTDRKSIENEEVVKYMSSLPTYLEKGETLKEKSFSVGVLDWRRLEKWQHKQSQTHFRSGGFSPSSSNTTSSSSSTEETSSNSSRGHSCSPAHQRTHRPTLQFHLNVSPSEDGSHDGKSFSGNFGDEKTLKHGAVKSLKMEQSVHMTYQSFDENTQSNLKDPRRSLDLHTHARMSTSKGKTKLQDGESLPKEEVLVSEAVRENSSCSTSCPHDSAEKDRVVKSSRQSFSSGSNSTADSGHLAYGLSYSCARPYEPDAPRHLKTENARIKSSSEMTLPSPYSGKILTSPPRRLNNVQENSTVMLKNLIRPDPSEGLNQKIGSSEAIKVRHPSPKKSTVMFMEPTTPDPPEGSDQKNGSSETIKVRCPSPTRRFSMAMSKIGRISGKKDTINTPQVVNSERVQASSSVDSGCDKSKSTDRARSSPLRRLLDPLLKPKTGNSDNITGSSERELPSVDKHCKPSTKRGESPTKRSLKVKLDLKSCKNIEIDDHCSNEKCGRMMLQALLQVKVRNGLPLFTFAVDNESDILAATVKKFGSSLKENSSCIYSFFTIQETKRKRGSWLSQGGKERCHQIMPNIIGKMKVSEVPSPGLNRDLSDFPFRIREFVLLSVGSRHAGLQTSDLQLNNELAAIVVKLPNRVTSHSDQSDLQDGNRKRASVSGLAIHPEGISQCTDRCNEDIGMTVILPGGAHGQPNKGGPSSLIERWKSGGSCDCGGWDLGCKLTLLVNHQRKSISAKAVLPAERFDLFTKGEVPDNKAIFSLSPFKDGIFSVEFSSSLKVLQAFTISLAVLNARNQEKFPESAHLVAEDTCEGTTFPEAQVVMPSKFVSIPPLSPVGRV